MNKPLPIYINETGPLPMKLTNDYLFRALLQTNEHVLKGLTASLLHLDISSIQSIQIANPIILGNQIDNKTFILDICVYLNDDTIINLEMQVINEHNWCDRSLSYLCRKFDHLNKGDNYTTAKSVYQIGLLDFSLFPEHPEFYARYALQNVTTHYNYSDKLHLYVLDLTRIDLATEEDKSCQLDYWASLFKAKTWEDLKLMSQDNELLQEAVSSMYALFQEENIRDQCIAREEYYFKENQRIEALKKVEELTANTINQENVIANQNTVIIDQKNTIAVQKSTIDNQKSTIADQKNMIAQKDADLQTALQRIAELEKQLRK